MNPIKGKLIATNIKIIFNESDQLKDRNFTVSSMNRKTDKETITFSNIPRK